MLFRSLHDKLMLSGSGLVVETIDAIVSGNAQRIPQTLFIKEGETLKDAPKLTKESGLIDWKRSSSDIFNQIRGLSPYPAAFSTLFNGKREIPVKIYSAIIENKAFQTGTMSLTAGETESDSRSFLRVGCGSGTLRITSIQAAGKKRLEIKDFLAGFRDISTYKFI